MQTITTQAVEGASKLNHELRINRWKSNDITFLFNVWILFACLLLYL